MTKLDREKRWLESRGARPAGGATKDHEEAMRREVRAFEAELRELHAGTMSAVIGAEARNYKSQHAALLAFAAPFAEAHAAAHRLRFGPPE